MFMELEGIVINMLMVRDNLTMEEANEIWQNVQSEIMDSMFGTSSMSVEEVIEDNLGITVKEMIEVYGE